MHRSKVEVLGATGTLTGLDITGLGDYAKRAAKFSDLLDSDDFADFTIDTTGRTVPDVARLVMAEAQGWAGGLGSTSAGRSDRPAGQYS